VRIAYVDTSVVIAIAFDEPTAGSIASEIKSFDRLYSSTLLESEFLSTACREGVLEQASALLQPIRWVFPHRRLTDEVTSILHQSYLRGADLHHLATALYLFPNPSEAFFLSLDKKQSQVAAALAFKTF